MPCAFVAGTGNSVTVGSDENDALDRAVEIKFQPTSISLPHVPRLRKPPPGPKIPIIHHTPPGPIVSRRFRLRVILAISASCGVGGGGMSLQIEDLTNGWAAIYDLQELHVEVGIGSPVSVSAAGPWHTLITSVPVGVGDLGGLVRLGGYGASVPLPNFVFEPSIQAVTDPEFRASLFDQPKSNGCCTKTGKHRPRKRGIKKHPSGAE